MMQMYDYFFRKVCSGQNILQKVPFARVNRSSKSVGGILVRLVNLFTNFANPFLNQYFGDMHCIDSYHLILNTCL